MLSASLDRIAARLVVRFGWQGNEKMVLERVSSFETTEDDSAWQLLKLASRASEPGVRARLFTQALEESHHAEVFRELRSKLVAQRPKFDGSGSAFVPSAARRTVERQPLRLDPEKPWRLFAYLAVGESSAARRFRSIAESLPSGEFRAALLKIIEEEEGHVALAGDLMTGSAGLSPAQARREMALIRAQRAGEAWLRLGSRMTGLLSRLILTVFFYAFGALIRTRRAERKTHESPRPLVWIP